MASKDKMSAVMDLRGLDLVTPVDLLSDGRTPYAKNFRLYAQQSDDRRVAVSSRKGPGFYTDPLNEILALDHGSLATTSTVKTGVVAGKMLQPFYAPSDNLITRIDIHVHDEDNASGPLMVQLWSDNNGPEKLLSESSILSGDIGDTAAFKTARFNKPVQMVEGVKYWIVLYIQDDGQNEYTLTTSEIGDYVWTTDSAFSARVEQEFGLIYQLYTTVGLIDKGAYRLNRESAENRTLVVYGTTLYYVNDAAGTVVPVMEDLHPYATEYSFTNADNKVFWVNGYDELTAWNGTFTADNPNLITNSSFTTNTSGWTADDGETITRSTAQFHTSPASLRVEGGYPEVNYLVTMEKGKRYKVSAWVRKDSGTDGLRIQCFPSATPNTGSSIFDETISTPAGVWTKVETYFALEQQAERLQFAGANTIDFYIDDVELVDTGIEIIRDSELPILSQILMHKDRMFGVVANEKNKIVYSENPGNPAYNAAGTVPTTAREQWYYAWLSVSYWYVPRPFNGSPITKLVSFQDALTIFTQDNKYVLSGYDRGSLNLRQSTGTKGALSARGVVSDENRIYFVADDGFYEHNGSSDVKLSNLVLPLFDACGHKEKITPVIWKSQVRFYMASQGSPVNDICLIWDKNTEEMLLDTDTYVNRALYYNDADDNNELVELNSMVPAMALAEQNYNSLGAPIDFEYRLKYDSMGTPMQRKRMKRYYPILQGVDSTFPLQLAMDKDFEDSPKVKEQLLVVNGAKIGEFAIGDGTIIGGDKSFKPKRQSYSGYAHYWQLRVKRKAVNNRVAFIGAQFSYKTKRL